VPSRGHLEGEEAAVSPFCGSGGAGAQRNRLAAVRWSGWRSRPAVRGFRWPAACSQWPCGFTRGWGSMSHELVEEMMAGRGTHREGGGGA
jgi:hypothetical protein